MERDLAWSHFVNEVGHALDRRQEGLGTPIPRALTVAIGPKARPSWLMSEASFATPRPHQPDSRVPVCSW